MRAFSQHTEKRRTHQAGKVIGIIKILDCVTSVNAYAQVEQVIKTILKLMPLVNAFTRATFKGLLCIERHSLALPTKQVLNTISNLTNLLYPKSFHFLSQGQALCTAKQLLQASITSTVTREISWPDEYSTHLLPRPIRHTSIAT
jgi:hypothetical protein